MILAGQIARYQVLSNFDVHTACQQKGISGARRLRDLAKEYCIRKNAASAYDYRDNTYTFRRGFMNFCGSWLREQLRKDAKADN
jgi:hypothetical protein